MRVFLILVLINHFEYDNALIISYKVSQFFPKIKLYNLTVPLPGMSVGFFLLLIWLSKGDEDLRLKKLLNHGTCPPDPPLSFDDHHYILFPPPNFSPRADLKPRRTSPGVRRQLNRNTVAERQGWDPRAITATLPPHSFQVPRLGTLKTRKHPPGCLPSSPKRSAPPVQEYCCCVSTPTHHLVSTPPGCLPIFLE